MGPPKQRWTAEEEWALKSGIQKHGAGRWRTILKDPDFSGILYLRSNIDLKDKWRNMNGSGSREKAATAFRSNQHLSKYDEHQMASTVRDDFSDDVADVKPLATSTKALPISALKRSEAKLENLIYEAITNLKEPTGSNKTAIAMYIEDQYVAPPDFQRLLSVKLKRMTEAGNLIKVNHKYRMSQSTGISEGKPKVLTIEGARKEPSRLEKDDIKHYIEPQIDNYVEQMRYMTPKKAAEAAAKYVAEAEIAVAEAEEAAKEAEAAEAVAEAARAFAQEAALRLKNKNSAKKVLAGFGKPPNWN